MLAFPDVVGDDYRLWSLIFNLKIRKIYKSHWLLFLEKQYQVFNY